jgi:hypothetical protein
MIESIECMVWCIVECIAMYRLNLFSISLIIFALSKGTNEQSSLEDKR